MFCCHLPSMQSIVLQLHNREHIPPSLIKPLGAHLPLQTFQHPTHCLNRNLEREALVQWNRNFCLFWPLSASWLGCIVLPHCLLSADFLIHGCGVGVKRSLFFISKLADALTEMLSFYTSPLVCHCYKAILQQDSRGADLFWRCYACLCRWRSLT